MARVNKTEKYSGTWSRLRWARRVTQSVFLLLFLFLILATTASYWHPSTLAMWFAFAIATVSHHAASPTTKTAASLVLSLARSASAFAITPSIILAAVF